MEERICPVEETVRVIGQKWKASILYHLNDGPVRFNQLKRLIPAITQRSLTLQLRALERDGLVKRTFYEEIPPRVEYKLTSAGKSLTPLFEMLHTWREKNYADVLLSRERYDLIHAEK